MLSMTAKVLRGPIIIQRIITTTMALAREMIMGSTASRVWENYCMVDERMHTEAMFPN
jgi:hypothetical protein